MMLIKNESIAYNCDRFHLEEVVSRNALNFCHSRAAV